jgi:glycosyltransferase involved in cell wall biosynthesis
MPLTVTALIPSYGRPDSLLRCLNGLLAGERRPDEIIVIARDTDAETRDAAKDWAGRTAFALHLVFVTEPGQIAAMNAGLPHVTADVVTFPDDDCVPRPDWLRRIMGHYEDSKVGGVGGRDVVHVEGLPEPPTVTRVGLITWYGRLIGNHHCNVTGGPRPVMHLKGVNMSFRRELLVPFDPNIRGPHINDTDISLAVYATGHKLIFDPEAKVDHYPAVRPDSPGGRNLLDPRLAFLDAHDWLYLLLKYQPWYLKPINALYVLLIGTNTRPGILLGLLRPRLWHTTLAATRGALTALCGWHGPSAGQASARHGRKTDRATRP